MKTYQDLMDTEATGRLADMSNFCRSVINEHISSKEYYDAKMADEYYHKHEPTIEKAMKFYYTATGRKEEDIYASNYKLKFLFFRKKVTQHIAYVLNKGIVMDDEIKKQLDPKLDRKAKQWAKYAMVSGKSYVFYNNGSLEVWHMVCNGYHPGFAPIYDADTGALTSGIRFWYRSATNRNLLTGTLYEPDGFTDFHENEKGDIEWEDKQPYVSVTVSNALETSISGRNYGRLPIVEASANDCYESDIVGLREDIDAYEFVKSDLCNELADFTGLWYSIDGAGGMDDSEIARFIQRLKTVHAAVVDGDGSGTTKISANQQNIPYDARAKMLEIIKQDLYENAQMVDMSQLSAAQKTTQEIQAAYQAQDNYCGELRDHIIDTIDELLKIAGLPEQKITMEFDKVVNISETVNAVMTSLPLIGDDIAVEILPILTADQKQRVKDYRAAEAIARMRDLDSGNDDEGDEEEEADA